MAQICKAARTADTRDVQQRLAISAALQQPSAEQSFLEAFEAWNPFTAAAICIGASSLQHLLSLSELELTAVLAKLPGLSQQSIQLFHQQISAGLPVRALLGTQKPPLYPSLSAPLVLEQQQLHWHKIYCTHLIRSCHL